ncbi:DUF3617 domain-containing protein [Alcaligenaceae bacterium]|nr:DUF3617 domain-containing protein [Alcaligenaceae bacterium]
MRISALLLLPFVFSAGVASAQLLENREPGLWEIKTNKGSPMAAMLEGVQDMLKSMPPAQRKQMEQMMQSKGVSVSEPTVVRQCLTPELIAREFQPYDNDPSMKCSNKVQKVSASEINFTFSCKNSSEKWNGDGRIWDATPKSYKSDMTMGGVVEGRPVKMSMSHEARWLGADCKGLKPQG